MKHIRHINEFFGLFKNKKEETVDEYPKQTAIRKELTKLLIMPGSYHINKDLTVDVYRNVEISHRFKGKRLPVNFGTIDGNFNCSKVGLETLEGSPRRVLNNFTCAENKLTSLVGGPEFVGGDYDCSRNKLTSLEGCPDELNKNLYCGLNELETLDGCPSEIEDCLSVVLNKLTKLDTVSNIKGNIYCGGNKIDSNDTGFMGWCGGKIDFDLDD